MLLPKKSRADLGWDALVDELARRTRTPRGRGLAESVAPLGDAATAASRSAEIGEARSLADGAEGLPLDGVRDVDAALARAEKSGALDLPSLRDIGTTLAAAAAVRRHLASRAARAPRLHAYAVVLADLDDVHQAIGDACDTGGGELRLADRASPGLGPLRRRAVAVRDELERMVHGLLDRSHIAPHLQDHFATQRDDRYVIPVRTDARTKVRGIVHGMSQSGQTVFVEPEEIVDLNNRLKLAELEVAEEERRILAELTALVTAALPRIRVNLEVLAALDLVDAGAKLATDLRGAPAEIGPGGFNLRRARHPLMVLSGRACVANDIVVARGRALVVSGPNAGGKTVALKTAGLCALMAASGLHPPAQEGSTVPWLDAVYTDVGDDQSLERNLSTFSAHVMHLCEFLGAAAPGVLVLLDEVAVGTDPDQGAALAQAVLESLATLGATVIVTTHYDRLKALAATDDRFDNASVGFDLVEMRPTYELHLGVPGASGAVAVARRLGLPDAVCARATMLAGERTALESLLMSVEGERRKLDTARAEIEAARAETVRLEAVAAAKLADADKRLAQARKGAHDEAVTALQRARAELERTRGVLRRGVASPTEATAVKREIEAVAESVRDAAPPAAPPPGRPATAADISAGRDVWVARLGGMARVLSSNGERVNVQAGVLKLAVPLDEIRITDGKKSAVPLRRAGFTQSDPPPPTPTAGRGNFRVSADVRGERVDAAIAAVEKALDDALRAGEDGLLVIHGHGTGALRDALRSHLRHFPGVTELRPGTQSEGGDGVTVVMLG